MGGMGVMVPLHGSETSLAKPPFSPQSCSSFSPRSALSLLVAVRWQAVNQSPGLSFGGVGKIISAAKETTPVRVALVGPYAHLSTVSCTGTVAARRIVLPVAERHSELCM